MLDFVIEQIAFDRIIAAVAVVVSLAFIRSYAGGVKNDHRRDLHQRTVILAGLPSSVLTCTLPTLAETGATIIILHPRPLELVAIINAIRLRFTDAEIFAEKCDLNDVESVKEFSDNWNKSERTPTGPSNTIESGQIRRIDGVIFSTDYEDGVVITPNQEKRDAAAHLLLLSLIPAIAHSPNSRDIRVIRLVQPFYTAGTLKVVNSKMTNINLAGIQALRGIALSRYLQSEIDSAKSQNVVPEVDKTRIEKSNVSCLTVCPGFVREATVWPLFSQYGIIGKLLYFLLLPSASEGSEVITYALMKEKPGKGMLYRDNKLVGLPKELQIELSNIDNLKSTASSTKAGEMGLCSSKQDKNGKQRSLEIDKQLEDDAKKMRRDCKILLLGSGESGKSTIVKQMKIIHQNGYSKEELIGFRLIVFKNVVDSAQSVVLALRKLSMEPISNTNQHYADYILGFRLDLEPGMTLNKELVNAIDSLWNDPIIPKLLDRSSEWYLMDSAPYFFQNVHRIGNQDYIPNENDVLRARIKTTGITETRFTMGQLSIHMFDVGGQRSERKKWIHCFEAVTSIIFCVAISEYDQTLLEESGQNRMQESLVLFESVINSRWFLRTSIILFMNKVDVFRVKITKVPLEKYFPEYSGGAELNKAAKYILWRFTQTNRARLSIYPHLTQATDTSNIRLVFAAVKETILQNALRDSGIL
ncbi:hypothetical protein E3Q18_00568 [Wallemia mellicola]|uniref:Guanine nucleotide binding protein, alpha subunit n=3 Tax=Wallemia mellicola TaxID=1708541 RepID=A0A4T0LLE0_9BASI|nr:hypothetical protein E3Q24_02850 [Wallemia mellicola]TIB88686.1 hypothetical protein E3Q21_00908 [Wallemia mellicola]TIB91345.1 hypothetical protein E3Q20_00894 [Wallemia mellicola]TIB94042.1 hypothetical protein E3Q19_00700 [Wallemia mellicola]TIC01909.1 hypothetical protein E3Q18_00568 [Wallemia mellicola]